MERAKRGEHREPIKKISVANNKINKNIKNKLKIH
jgi:hypothetical protein